MNALPVGTYLLHTGPRHHRGKWLMGRTTEDMRTLLYPYRQVVKLTEKPQKAQYVIVPDGVTQVGASVRKQNSRLANDPHRLISEKELMQAITNLPQTPAMATKFSQAYKVGGKNKTRRRRRKRRNKRGKPQPTSAYDQGFVVLPENLRPEGQASFLAPSYVSKIQDSRTIRIQNYQSYDEARDQLRVDRQGVPQGYTPAPPQQPSAAQQDSWNPETTYEKQVYAEDLQEIDQLLNDLEGNVMPSPTPQAMSPPPPLEPVPPPQALPPQQTQPTQPKQLPVSPSDPPPPNPSFVEAGQRMYASLEELHQTLDPGFNKLSEWRLLANSTEGPTTSVVFRNALQAVNRAHVDTLNLLRQVQQQYVVSDAPQQRMQLAIDENPNEPVLDTNSKLLLPPSRWRDFLQAATAVEAEGVTVLLRQQVRVLRYMFQKLAELSQQYFGAISGDLRSTQMTRVCDTANRVCLRYIRDNERFITGQPLDNTLDALYDNACRFFAKDDTTYEVDTSTYAKPNVYQCGGGTMAASLIDATNYLLYQGALESDPAIDVRLGQEESCNVLRQGLNDMMAKLTEIDRARGKDNERPTMLSRYNVAQALTILKNLPEIYNKFMQFLFGGGGSSPAQAFTEIAGLLTQPQKYVDQDNKTELWILMYIVAIVYITADMCWTDVNAQAIHVMLLPHRQHAEITGNADVAQDQGQGWFATARGWVRRAWGSPEQSRTEPLPAGVSASQPVAEDTAEFTPVNTSSSSA